MSKSKAKSKTTKKTPTPKYKSKDGQPFFAARIPAKLLRAFQAYAKKNKTKPGSLVIDFMASTTGVAP